MSGPAAHTKPERRLRVLVIAEMANPEWVSVPLVGWSVASALREICDVHILTHIRNRMAFENAGLIEGTDFTIIDSETVARPIYKLAQKLRMGEGKGWTMVTALSSRLSYPYFERIIWKKFGKDIANGSFDIVHRITPLTPTANSTLAQKCAKVGVPFVMGPLNGGVPWPKGFDSERRREKEWLSYIRGAYKLSLSRRRMLNAASAIISGSRYTASELPIRHRHKVALIPENAINPDRFDLGTNATSPMDRSTPLRGCFVGRLVPYKGPDMLIEAAEPFLRDGSLNLDIVGNGPMETELQARVSNDGLEDAVTFHGWVEHEKVQEILSRADLLTFPSVREFGGGVVLEAMALGVVPVVCNYAGPAELVDQDAGFKVAMGNRTEVVANYRETLAAILAEPHQLQEKSKAAREKVAAFYTWACKADQIKKIYDWVLSGQGPIPAPIPFDPPLWADKQTTI